jgi:hypothetical protein
MGSREDEATGEMRAERLRYQQQAGDDEAMQRKLCPRSASAEL